ncbi:laccase-4-like [Thrips palmi]|uniref:Laccase-4-like n=1 Tax=Thrips palmi TaxID=161013 RepID=A0A6P9AFF3_THRPL|nr:laccase-4-like [Thrips palmi]
MWTRTALCSLCVLALGIGTQTQAKLRTMELERTVDFGQDVGGSSHPCYRPCGEPMQCNYTMTLSLYSTWSMHCGDCPRTKSHCSLPGCITAGGTDRVVYAANLMVPGPAVHVCEGDTVRVRVENAYPNEGVTLHWHGVWMRSTPHMDGVPYISQCPIQPSNVFEYMFRAYPAGTHIWHAHIGFLETDGLFGSLVVRERRSADPHADLYDEDLAEHALMVWHWYPHRSDEYLPLRLHRNESVSGAGLLVNGKGVIQDVGGVRGLDAPHEEIRVQQGKRYRLRLAFNSAIYCPVHLSIDNHTMTAIASDGGDIKPVQVDSLMLNAGERWDVVVAADQPVDQYWVRMQALGDCGAAKGRVFQQAALVYEGSNAAKPAGQRPNYESSGRVGKLLNPMQVVATDYSQYELVHLMDLENVEPSVHGDISGPADHILYMTLDFKFYDELAAPGPYPQNNAVTFEFPAVPMILERYEKDPDRFLCTAATAHEHCIDTYCSCPLREILPLGALVEIVLVDETTDRAQDHPYHIHGTNFHVVAAGSVGASVSMAEVRRRNERGDIAKRLDATAPLKDTVSVPSQGYTVLRFRTKNPGFWFFHCHVSNHVHLGMGLVLQVGNHSDMPAVPHNFPRCGNYVFDPEVPDDSGSSSAVPSWTAALVLAVVARCLV